MIHPLCIEFVSMNTHDVSIAGCRQLVVMHRLDYNTLMFKKKKKQRAIKPFEYILPADADRVRIEALGMGALCACRDYPLMKTRATLETEARAALATLQSQKPGRYCNDFEALCTLYSL